MKRRKVIKCQKYGRLTALFDTGELDKWGSHYWECVCDCGNHKRVISKSLLNGNTSSCGCYRNEQISKANTKHGMSRTSLHIRWTHIKERCNNQNDSHYKDYGGRGIKICKEWEDFIPFMEWSLSHGYKEELTIERLDVNGDYCPENCTWIPSKDQNKNRRPFKRGKNLKNRLQDVG